MEGLGVANYCGLHEISAAACLCKGSFFKCETNRSRCTAKYGPGPVTFLLHDQLFMLKWSNYSILFAGNTTLLTRGRNLKQPRAEADHLMEQAKDWFNSNSLKLNDKKTQNLLCLLKSMLQEEEAVKLLGFWVDPKQSWKEHNVKVCVKLSRGLYLLKKLGLAT